MFDHIGKRIIVTQEASGITIDETVWKAYTAGDCITVRLPHAIHSPSPSFAHTAKLIELNTQNLPWLTSIAEKSVQRRIKGVEKTQAFANDHSSIDCQNKES